MLDILVNLLGGSSLLQGDLLKVVLSRIGSSCQAALTLYMVGILKLFLGIVVQKSLLILDV